MGKRLTTQARSGIESPRAPVFTRALCVETQGRDVIAKLVHDVVAEAMRLDLHGKAKPEGITKAGVQPGNGGEPPARAFRPGVDAMEIKDTTERLEVARAILPNSSFDDVNISNTCFHNADLSGLHVYKANMTDMRVEDANVSNSRFTNVNMSNVQIDDAQIAGMSIDGVSVADMMAAYRKQNGSA